MNSSITEKFKEPAAQEVIAGLSPTPEQVSPKYFYDEKGSALFDAITKLDEYYVPRVEKAIIERHRAEICAAIGSGTTLVESGATSGTPA
jgi:L-histidine N-alpha-methyltransferase